ncbi:MAG: hypothetical protein Q3988_04090 [Gemella sp.]|nr:hypothetical protein [Gemella sp.]
MKKLDKILTNRYVPIAIGGILVGASGGIFGSDSIQHWFTVGLFFGWSLNEFLYKKYVI